MDIDKLTHQKSKLVPIILQIAFLSIEKEY